MSVPEKSRANPISLDRIDQLRIATTRQRRQRAKSNLEYWQGVVYQPGYRRNGKVKRSGFYVVRLAHQGHRTTFPLYTANKAAAAIKAREIYNVLIANGWENALEQFKKNVKPAYRPPVVPGIEGSSSVISFDHLKRDFLALIVPSTTRECWLWAGEHAPRNGRPIFRGEWGLSRSPRNLQRADPCWMGRAP
jgi:hypothetical protein